MGVRVQAVACHNPDLSVDIPGFRGYSKVGFCYNALKSRKKLNMLRIFLLLALLLSSLHAGASNFPRPAALEPAVKFWTRVYTQVSTDQGYVHDAVHMSVVYETLDLPRYASNTERGSIVTQAKFRTVKALNAIARGKRSNLTTTEARVLAAWPKGTSAKTFATAADNVRFQLGQSDRFKEGLVRSGQWRKHIRTVLTEHNLPLELDVLPHVESSFNPSAWSKAAAAGMWQFMPVTGREFMRVDSLLDERMDPFISTYGAAKLLKRNYRTTGSWPLALTSYNHGTSGVMRAARQVGTTDIGTIVQKYKGDAFGFASRNFYASFLAALEVDRNAKKYFGPVRFDVPTNYDVVVARDYISARGLAQQAGISMDELKKHNPALQDPILNGERYIPRGYEIRLPRNDIKQPLEQLIAALPANARLGHQKPDAMHKIVPGDTLSTIATRYGTTVSRLKAINGLRSNTIRVGKTLVLPGNVVAEPTVARRGSPASQSGRSREYVIQRGDSLWSIARRFNVSEKQLVAWNGISNKSHIRPGQKLKVAASS